jgi:tRNA(Ile)-lysidine synthase TilS/MesJ
MRCKYCKLEAVTVKGKLRLCKNHFNQYYINRIKKVIRKVPVKDKTILVAISGGKDSVSVLHALNSLKEHYKYELAAVFIDLGIKTFSSESLYLSEKLCKELSVPFNVLNMEKEYGFTTEDLGATGKKVCSECGTAKRYVLNRYAFENNFDFIVTGHNMDDEIIFLNQNILSNNLNYIKRYTFYWTPTLSEVKLIGKIKPQFFISENDNKEYCKINSLDYVQSVCPFSENSSHTKLEEGIKLLNKKMDYSYGFINFFIKLNKFLPEEESRDYKFCKNCGFPTSNFEYCKFCKTSEKIKKIKNEKH